MEKVIGVILGIIILAIEIFAVIGGFVAIFGLNRMYWKIKD